MGNDIIGSELFSEAIRFVFLLGIKCVFFCLQAGLYGWRVWIGAEDKHGDMRFSWTDGTGVAADLWPEGQPNGGGDHRCVDVMHYHKYSDEGCQAERAGYICQIDL